jgi:hypothetical protein
VRIFWGDCPLFCNLSAFFSAPASTPKKWATSGPGAPHVR